MTHSSLHTAFVLHEILDGRTGAFEDITKPVFAAILNGAPAIRSLAAVVADGDATGGDMTGGQSTGGVVLTFDDGHASDHDIALPMLAKAGATATFFIVPDFIGRPGFMTWDQVRSLHAAGMEIGSHSMTHPDFRTVDADTALAEFKNSKAAIEAEIGAPVTSFAFPYGFAPRRYYALARAAGYTHVMGSHHGCIGATRDHILPRNSIHAGMTAAQITMMLQPGYRQRLRWWAEDAAKAMLKRVLPLALYHRLRGLIAGTGPSA